MIKVKGTPSSQNRTKIIGASIDIVFFLHPFQQKVELMAPNAPLRVGSDDTSKSSVLQRQTNHR